MWPGELAEEKNLLPGIETRFLERPVRIPASVCTDYAISAHPAIINIMLECTQLHFLEQQKLCFCYTAYKISSETQDAGVDTTLRYAYSPISLLNPKVLTAEII